MLHALKISNLAVIEAVDVAFGPGFTVLTGETGAGKSILLDALALLVGRRAGGDVVRAGSEEAIVEGIFEKTPALGARLLELGLPDCGDEVSVRRAIAREGRAKAYVNGALVTVGVLARMMRGLVDISGQHEYVSLFDQSLHRALLDRAGRDEALLEAYQADLADLKRVESKIFELGESGDQAQRETEFLRFQIAEIARLAPQVGEEEGLDSERKRLNSVEKLRQLACSSAELLSSQQDSTLQTLGRCLSLMSEAARIDPALQGTAESLAIVLSELQGASRAIDRYAENLESNPERLNEVEDRLDSIRHLARKNGCRGDELAAEREGLSAKLLRLEQRESDLAGLHRERAAAEVRARSRAAALSSARKETACQISLQVTGALVELGIPQGCFEARVFPVDSLRADGMDEVGFFFAANLGDPVRPLAEVASGGEASRILLAFKRAIASSDAVGCCVLDEADGGVGGAAAEVVGRVIREVSAHRQVLCVTHLAQVAAYADAHLRVAKEQRSGRSASSVVLLRTRDDRIRELARILGGIHTSPEAFAAAEALLRSAERRARKARAAGTPRMSIRRSA